MRKETQKTVTPGISIKMPAPPLIHPRETKTQKLRRTIKPYPFIHDTFDNIIKVILYIYEKMGRANFLIVH